MTSIALLAMAVALGGSGEIHRCAADGGRIVFQDKPCPGGASKGIKTDGDPAIAQRELQRWLAEQRERTPPVAPTPSGSTQPRDAVTVTEARLAVCSERFLGCASGDAATMDACVAALPRCGPSGGSCCPQACIARYQTLRQEGLALASAVRLALLDPSAPACAAR